MQSNDFDWQLGNVVYWDLERVTPDTPIEQQYEHLKEDLAQVEFGSAVLLDIGWYPEFSPTGRFVVSVVRDQEWEQPVFRVECKAIPSLCNAIRWAIDVAQEQ